MTISSTGCGTSVWRRTVLPPGLAQSITSTRPAFHLSQTVPRRALRLSDAKDKGGPLRVLRGENIVDAQQQADDWWEQRWLQFKGFDPRRPFWQAFTPVVKEATWLNPTDPLFSRTLPERPMPYVLAQGPTSETELIYRSAPIGSEEGDVALSRWLENDGAAYRTALAEAASESAKMLRYALQYMAGKSLPVVSESTDLSFRPAHGGDGKPDKLHGDTIEDAPERVIFRAQTGVYLFIFLSVQKKGLEL